MQRPWRSIVPHNGIMCTMKHLDFITSRYIFIVRTCFFFTKSTTPKWLAKVFKKIGESIFECTLNQPHVAQLLCKVL